MAFWWIISEWWSVGRSAGQPQCTPRTARAAAQNRSGVQMTICSWVNGEWDRDLAEWDRDTFKRPPSLPRVCRHWRLKAKASSNFNRITHPPRVPPFRPLTQSPIPCTHFPSCYFLRGGGGRQTGVIKHQRRHWKHYAVDGRRFVGTQH